MVVSFPEREAARALAFRAALRRARENYGAAVAVAVAVLLLGVVAACVLSALDPYALVYYGDAASHLVKSRALVDWGDDAGLARFGTVWLPVPHLLLLPFTLLSFGWAGAVVGLPCLALSAGVLYFLLRRDLGASPRLAAAGALLFALNPNLLYVSMTAMTEAPFLLFFIGSAYFLSRWLRDPDRLRYLALTSVLVVQATLCRYEGWLLPIALVALVLWRARRARAVALSLISLAGVAAWIAYNALLYGDPLQFADAEFYSAAAQALSRPPREALFLAPVNVLGVYAGTAALVYGPVLIAALLGLFRAARGPLPVFLALPPFATLLSMLGSTAEMTFWFNARYVSLLGPLLVVLAVALGVHSARRHTVAAVGLCALFFPLVLVLGTVPFYLDARNGFERDSASAVQAGEALRSRYDGGRIVVVTGSSSDQRIMVTAGIPLAQYDEIIDSSTWKGSYTEPWRYGRWLVLSRTPGADAASAAAQWRGPELGAHYSVAYDNGTYEILIRS